MKRNRIIATVCACAVCLGLLITGVIAAVRPAFNMSGKMAFDPKGVFCDISGEVYRGESYTELERLTDDPTYTMDTVQTYILGEEGNIIEQSEGTPSWSPADVPFLPAERLIQYRISFANKGTTNISVIPSEISTLPANVTATEESSATLLIEPGKTEEFRLLLTLAAGATTFSSTQISMSFDILETSSIETNESWFTMNSATPTQLDGLTDAYKSAAPRVLRVPETVGGNNVVSTVGSDPVSDYAFLNYVQNTKYVILPNTLETIGTYSFYICKFKGIYLPKSLKSIMGAAFQSCTMLGSICLPEGLTNMGGPYDVGGYSGLFNTCTSLLSVVIPSSLTSICGSAFGGCTSLASVIIQNGVTSIGDSAFRDCTSLTSITIPSGVTSIGSSAFSGCTSLTSVYMEGAAPAIHSTALGYLSSAPYTSSALKIYVKSANLSGYQPTSGYSTSNSSVNNWYYYKSKITTY